MRKTSPLCLILLVAAAAVGACATAGSKAFREAERLRNEGKISESAKRYEEAISLEPKNQRYRDRLASAKAEAEHAVDAMKDEARAKEKASDWAGAEAIYGRALLLKPQDAELDARKSLCGLKVKGVDADAWFLGVSSVAERYPQLNFVQRTLLAARSNAYAASHEAAHQLLARGDGPGAVKAFERAKQIDPSAPGFDVLAYNKARAMDLAAQAELRALSGEMLAAHQLYKDAYALSPLPEIQSKLNEVAKSASSLAKKLDAARAKKSQGRLLEAIKLYDELLAQRGVPAEVGAERTEVAELLASRTLLDAQVAAERGDIQKTRAALLLAIHDASKLAVVNEALGELTRDHLSRAIEILDARGIAKSDPIAAVIEALARSKRHHVLSKVKDTAKKDPAKAFSMLDDLRSFDAEMPEIAAVRRTLVKDAFTATLEEAAAKAVAGDDEGAAALLKKALKESKAPGEMAQAAEEGARHLGEKRPLDAERAFSLALSLAPRSLLAQRGLDIARLRKRQMERVSVEALKNRSVDRATMVAFLESLRVAEPQNAAVRAGREVLVARIEKAGPDVSTAELGGDLKDALRLSELSQEARVHAEKAALAVSEGRVEDADAAFKLAMQLAPEATFVKVAHEASRRRLLSMLGSDVKATKQMDANAARALAKLLKADPNHPDARRTLARIFEKAEEQAKRGNLAGVAEQLELAVLATEPAPGVEAAISRGNQALRGGDVAAAEKAFAEALELEPEQAAANIGRRVARDARVQGLKWAVEKAKSGSGAEDAGLALKKAIEMDPSGPEARQAFLDVLLAARARASEGKDREAAQLLDAANVVSKPQSARSAISDANRMLSEGRHAQAEAAYESLLKSAESRVAASGKEIARDRRLAVLRSAAEGLKSGQDVEGGAKAVRELLTLDPASKEANDAIAKSHERAKEAATRGDDKAATKELRAANEASGVIRGLEEAIALYESGKFGDASKAFSKLKGDLASLGQQMCEIRTTKTLVAGLGGAEADAAKSIRALLAKDPNHREAKVAYAKFFDRARAAQKQNQAAEAARLLEAALLASTVPEKVEKALRDALAHHAAGRFSQAEVGFVAALGLSSGDRVATTGKELASQGRKSSEREAFDAISKGTKDPVPSATMLADSLLIEPTSPLVLQAIVKLHARAKKSSDASDLADAARAIEAAVLLERLDEASVKQIATANQAFVRGDFEEAETTYAALASATESRPRASTSAGVGRTVARERRVAALKAKLKGAQRDAQAEMTRDLVQKILAIAPEDKEARSLVKATDSGAVQARIDAAKTQKGFGRLGVARLYLVRALSLQPEHAAAKSELSAIDAELKKSLDFVVYIPPIVRGKGGAAGCSNIESSLLDLARTTVAKREDLGFFALGRSFSEAFERRDADAPSVNGTLGLEITKCHNDAKRGRIEIAYALKTPEQDGAVVVGGSVPVDLPEGLVPKDEQDSAGVHAKALLAKRAAAALAEALFDKKSDAKFWPLVAAERAREKGDASLVAEHYARLKLLNPRGVDADRVAAVEKFLDEQIR